MGLQRVGHDWATELNWCSWKYIFFKKEKEKTITIIIQICKKNLYPQKDEYA